MSRWFRFYDDTLNDPKILKLSDKLHRVWVGILCVASKNNGQLPSLDDMALMIRMTPAKLDAAIKSLMIAGLIDQDGPILSPHNWNARQFKSDVSTERVKRFRKQERNVSVTPPETETETETEAEKKDTSLRSVDDFPADYRECFWKAYPRKAGKALAIRKLETVRKSGKVTFAALMAGVDRYASACLQIETQFQKHPATWLNAGCWDDDAAALTRSTGPPARPLTEFQRRRNETKDILDELDSYVTRSSGSEENLGVLPGDTGERPKGLHGGPGGDVINLPVIGHRTSG